ncbi:MAG: UPF0104 family protein [Calditrichaeota bacterium]|nr:MAG: UPF0104 family protein [Calditrichota bacterium]
MTISLLIRRAIRITLFVIPLAIFGNIIYTLLASEKSNLLSIIELHPGWLMLAIVLSLSPWIFSLIRLSVWNHFFDLKLKKREMAEAILANEVAAITTPTAVGGGYAKIGILILRGISPGMATSLMVIGSIEDYLLFPILIPLCWYFFPPGDIKLLETLGEYLPSAANYQNYLLVIGALAILGCSALLFSSVRRYFANFFELSWWHNKVFSTLMKALIDFKTAFILISKGGKRRLLLNAFLATTQWILRYSVFTALAFGLGFSPGVVEFFLLQWLVFMLLNIVPTPGAIGGAEMVFVYIFEGFIPAGSLAIAASYWRFVSTYLQLLVAALILVLFERPEFNLHKKQVQSKTVPRLSPERLQVTVVDIPTSLSSELEGSHTEEIDEPNPQIPSRIPG